MKVTIFSTGDPQAGIGGQEAVVEMPYFEFVDEDHRQGARELLGEAFSEIFDDRAHVIFQDECLDCRKRMTDCNCKSNTG